ncbi:enediyne antibiotic chromoprotein [Amycolatopsis sp. NPDC051071]|uniref:enediyne antibiotic chromoprotein n=1 Tax=Amycolatopsis sp. NPDC051071 TaxID=3154637 RepID=UPI00343571AD
MRVKNGTSRIAKVGAIAVFATGLALGSYSVANADTVESVSVTPTSGLTNGATVQVSGSGLAPNSTFWIGECGQVGADCLGDAGRVLQVTSNSSGSISTPLTVVKQFNGHKADGSTVAIDCNTVQCAVGVFTADASNVGKVTISFQ